MVGRRPKLHAAQLDGLLPEYSLLAAICRQAVADARQTKNLRLRVEARAFLRAVAPTLVDQLLNPLERKGNECYERPQQETRAEFA